MTFLRSIFRKRRLARDIDAALARRKLARSEGRVWVNSYVRRRSA